MPQDPATPNRVTPPVEQPPADTPVQGEAEQENAAIANEMHDAERAVTRALEDAQRQVEAVDPRLCRGAGHSHGPGRRHARGRARDRGTSWRTRSRRLSVPGASPATTVRAPPAWRKWTRSRGSSMNNTGDIEQLARQLAERAVVLQRGVLDASHAELNAAARAADTRDAGAGAADGQRGAPTGRTGTRGRFRVRGRCTSTPLTSSGRRPRHPLHRLHPLHQPRRPRPLRRCNPPRHLRRLLHRGTCPRRQRRPVLRRRACPPTPAPPAPPAPPAAAPQSVPAAAGAARAASRRRVHEQREGILVVRRAHRERQDAEGAGQGTGRVHGRRLGPEEPRAGRQVLLRDLERLVLLVRRIAVRGDARQRTDRSRGTYTIDGRTVPRRRRPQVAGAERCPRWFVSSRLARTPAWRAFSRRSGADGVLAEIGRIKSGWARHVYFVQLFEQANLDSATLARSLRQAGQQVDSDFARAVVLKKAARAISARRCRAAPPTRMPRGRSSRTSKRATRLAPR